MRGNEALAFRGVQQGLWVVDGPDTSDRSRWPADHTEQGHTGRGGAESGAIEWCLDDLFGRLVELSGGAAGAVLTFVFRLVREAQERGEPVAWITGRDRTFYPPDVAEGGVDLAALAVVRLPAPALAPRVADPLVRSGGFGLLVMDLGVNAELPIAALPIATQSRLAGLAKRHHAALLCLTRKPREAPSLGPLVSMRGEVVRERVEDLEGGDGETLPGERATECYRLAVRTLKRKGSGFVRPAFAKATAGSSAFAEAKAEEEVCRAPDGLC